MYDRLMTPPDVLENVVGQVVRLTQPNVQTSSLLDLGTGTALVAATLAKQGYTVFAVDKSAAMLEQALRHRIPTLHLKQASFLEPMLWESGSFSHILCTGFTLYTLDAVDKRRLFENCLHWLKPGGYFIVHVMDADKFDTIIPGGRPPVPVKSRERVTNTVIDFVDFEYRGSYTFPDKDTMQLRQAFVDAGKTRELEQTFHLVSVPEVLAYATRAGFGGQGYAALAHDPHQYLYIFVK
jgi:SAM-dependent methyltransferase